LTPPLVFTVLPLPWSIELACRLHGGGAPLGAALAGYLLERAGCRAHHELRAAAAADDARLARDATSLLGRLPVAPTSELGIAVLGPLEVCHDGVPAVARELRRARVRELLAVLVVEPTISRDRIVELLWPDLDPESGGRNLRVTLTHLHRLLEPDRTTGEATFHVRADASSIRLVASPRLRVDVWELRRLSAAAAVAREVGDVGAAIALLTEAAALSRGTPLVDLDRVAGFDAEVEALRLLVVTTLLDLAALHLTAGSAGPALACAERALILEPYLESAHRLAIAATAQRGDGARTAAAVDRTCRLLDELGVTPEPATEMLIRSATRRSCVDRVALAASA
jgi:DNA-binding SARP family transcriptional activator